MKTPEKGNYITLEDVRVSYDRRTKSITITSKDPDLPPGGFNLTLNAGRHEEKSLRAMLELANKMPDEKDTSLRLPDYLTIHDAMDTEVRRFPLGITETGSQVDWNIDTHPHLLLRGQPGSGKSNIIYGLLQHCLKYENHWDVRIADNKVDHGDFHGESWLTVAEDAENVSRMISELYDEMTSPGVQDREILLVIDEVAVLQNADDETDTLGKLEHILRMGRSKGVHLVISTNVEYYLPRMLSENMFTVVTSFRDRNIKQEILGKHAVLPSNANAKGRGYASGFGLDCWLQFFYNYPEPQ